MTILADAIEGVRALGARLHIFCDGPVIDEGFAIPMDKHNHAPRIIPGLWAIRRCSLCLTTYARPSDLLIPGALPSDKCRAEAEAAAAQEFFSS